MARIRHIALATTDPEATAKFYKEGLGLREVGKVNSTTAEGYYLSDGHVNLAVLKFKGDDPATTEGILRYTGVHHFGLQVDDMDEARARIEAAGAVHRPYPGTEEMAARGNVEVKFSVPTASPSTSPRPVGLGRTTRRTSSPQETHSSQPREENVMPRIKHIAIATQDPEATAKFYKDGLGLREAGVVNSVAAEGYYLTDGYINVAILRFKDDDAATTEGEARYTGIHHFGFEVDSMDEAEQQILSAGAVHRPSAITTENAQLPRNGNVEVKFVGPDGVTVDLSQAGWVGTAPD